MKTVVALAAACFLGIGFVIQQHAAYREPLGETPRLRLLSHLMRPIRLLGVAAMVVGRFPFPAGGATWHLRAGHR
jgi:hypothetical protein